MALVDPADRALAELAQVLGMVTAEQLAGMMTRGAVVKATTLTDKYGPDEFMAEHETVIPLFALQPDGTIMVSTVDTPLALKEGSTVVSMRLPE